MTTVPTESTIILAAIGMFGIIATAVITTYAIRANRTGDGRYQ